MGITGIKKNRLAALLFIAIMVLAISGCTTQGDGSSSIAPDAVHQIMDGGTAIYDDDPIAEEPQLDVDALNGVTDSFSGQGEIISAEPHSGDAD